MTRPKYSLRFLRPPSRVLGRSAGWFPMPSSSSLPRTTFCQSVSYPPHRPGRSPKDTDRLGTIHSIVDEILRCDSEVIFRPLVVRRESGAVEQNMGMGAEEIHSSNDVASHIGNSRLARRAMPYEDQQMQSFDTFVRSGVWNTASDFGRQKAKGTLRHIS